MGSWSPNPPESRNPACGAVAAPLWRIIPGKARAVLELPRRGEGGEGGVWQQLLFPMTLPGVIFSARLPLTLKMEEARDIFHPKLNGKWQVSDFCKFLSLA